VSKFFPRNSHMAEFQSWKNLRTELKNFIWERKNETETFRVEAHFSEPLKAC
jgi:hypothetical protein